MMNALSFPAYEFDVILRIYPPPSPKRDATSAELADVSFFFFFYRVTGILSSVRTRSLLLRLPKRESLPPHCFARIN